MNQIKIFKTLFFILVVSIVFSCNNKTSPEETFIKYQKNESLESFATKIKDHYKLPSIAIALINDDSITDIVVKGKNKVINGTDLNVNSKFQIGSCGKAFTSLLVATFIEQGFIEWDTKLIDVFKDINIHPKFKNVTVKQLLSHTSGIRKFSSDEEVFNLDRIIPQLKGNTTQKRKIFTKWNLEQEPANKIGEYHYSNAGYIIVASVLEELCGMSYENLMKKNVFVPLDLKSAEFGYPFIKDDSQPHRHMFRDENGRGIILKDNERIPDEIFNPAGFISLSIEDFAKFVLTNKKALNGKEIPYDNYNITELFKPVIKLNNGYEAALGWQIIYINGVRTYGHTGSDQSIRAAMSINTKTNQAVVFATNIGDEISEIAMMNVIIELLNL
ncbi:MAG: serine hydrolase domain-containing protein [Bacteroidota bacterium]